MADLPALSAATERALKLHFEALLESFRLSRDAAIRYAGAGEMNRRIASSTPPASTSRFLKGWLTANLRAKRECGITSSVEVATRRFDDLASAYFKLWSLSGGYELFLLHVEALKERVLNEIKSIWGETEVTAKWYESVCAAYVNAAVSERLKGFRDQARYSEMVLLARTRVSESRKPADRGEVKAPPAVDSGTGYLGDNEPTPAGQVSNGPKPQSRKRGPKRDYKTALQVAEIVKQIAPDGKWGPLLDEICESLDEHKIPMPKPWKSKHGFRNWCEAGIDTTARGRHMAIEAIKHRLKLAKEAPTETIP